MDIIEIFYRNHPHGQIYEESISLPRDEKTRKG